MITATVTDPMGRVLAVWTSSEGTKSIDPIFAQFVSSWRPKGPDYLPFPDLTAIEETAKAVGCKVVTEGEEDPLPPDAVQ